nr:uncharacterized mitochondrial protein AtMg00810-like [Nicotiana tomentosiformis]
METEMKALEDNRTLDVVDLPKGMKAIGSKWVYKIKYKASGEVERFKARLVAKSYSQREGLDYNKIFSPVAKMVTVRSVIALAASKGWNISQKKGDDFVAVLIYVNDLLITGNNEELINETKVVLHQKFEMKDLGDLKYFLGIEVVRSKEGILLNQRKYYLQLISDLGLSGTKPVSTPIDLNQKFTSAEFDRHTGTTNDEILTYSKLSVSSCKSPKYFIGILLLKNWASCPNTRRSVIGYLIKFGNSLISWKSKKQHTVSRSSVEAEYRSLVVVTAKVVLLLGLFAELGVHIKRPVEVSYDSKAALQIAANPIFHERTKYIEIDCHFVRDKIKQGVFNT